MVYTDSYTPTTALYECQSCQYRESTATLSSCPACGDVVRNISVPRE